LKDAAKLLKVQPKTIRAHIRRGLPLVDKRIDLIVYAAWLNQQEGYSYAVGRMEYMAAEHGRAKAKPNGT
jgi:hypothetical protein